MRPSMRSLGLAAFALCLIFAASVTASWAGGAPSFAFQAPDASVKPGPSSPVMVVHAFSCHSPTEAAVKAYAEGMVGGARRTIPLKLEGTSRKGVYNLSRQWPSEGTWALVFSIDQGGQTTALVKLDAQGNPTFDPGKGCEGGQLAASSVRSISGVATTKDVDSVLLAKLTK